ncbi:MAG: ribosome maturation factor RimP [Deltaproteobacteria bacterium]|nr:ribosome maturation factor RimP [Deltaproteobacteria bacterium]
MPDKDETITRVTELVQPLLTAQGVELVELQYSQPRRGKGTLRLFLDQPGGITLEVLSRLSRVVSELLDVHDLIPGPFTLELSSPGATRALKKPEDYRRYTGRLVRITTRTPWEGRQVHRGILQGLEEETVCLQEEGKAKLIPLKEIAKARLDLEIKNSGKEG